MLRSTFFLRRAERSVAPFQVRGLKSKSKRGSSSSDLSSDEERLDKVNRNIKVSEDTCSYGVRKIKEWMKEKDLAYTCRLRRIVDPLVYTGMFIDFPFTMSLSVETHPSVCSSNFAETAIMPTLETIEDPTYTKELESPRLILLDPLGYNENDFVLRHKEANDLFEHMSKFRKVLLRGSFVNGIVELPSGETIDLRAPSVVKASKTKAAVKEQMPIYVKSDYGPANMSIF